MFARIRTTLLLMLLLMPCVLSAEEMTPANIVNKAIKDVFIPSVSELEEKAQELQKSITQGCKSRAVKSAFEETVKAYSVVEYYRLGAINQNNRAERIFFWPDRKATGQKQMRRLLKDPKRDMLNAELIGAKSVAVQGLPAIERIIYATNSSDEKKDCVVAEAIAGNIHTIAENLEHDWSAENGIAAKLTKGGADSIYRNSTEAMTAILTLSENAIVAVSDKKLSLIIEGLEQSSAIPKSAPFWRSGMTFEHLAGNLKAIEQLLVASGLAEAGDVESSLKFEFRTATTMLNAATKAFESQDTETAASRLLAVQLILQGVHAVIAETIAPQLGVVTGFNSSDGD